MSYKHLVAGFLALAASFSAFSATLAERSPFTQGLWWNSQRPGMGLELFNVGETGAATWYTYEADGRAIWYTAQGPLDGSTWPLMKHRWTEGRKQAPVQAGTFKVTIRHPEKLTLDFTIAGASGTIDIEPFIQSGVPNEIDHSGSYFNPANSGWGLTFTQQGDIQGGVLYTYDPTGAPTWYSGFDRNADNSFAVISATGACPTCAYTPSINRPAGRIAYAFNGESALVLRNQVSVPMADGVGMDGAPVKQLGRPASTRPADRQLARVDSDAALKAYLVAGILNSPPSPGDFSAPAPAAPFSTTNLQEADVDEGDLVKSDGRYVYTFAEAPVNPEYAGSITQRVSVLRVARIDDGGKALSIVGKVDLAAGATERAYSAALYVDSGRIVAVTGSVPFSGKSPTWMFPGSWLGGTTRVEILQAGADGLPKSQWHAQIDGHVLSTRRIGDRLYLVTRHAPSVAGIRYSPPNNPADLALAAATPLEDLLPKIRIQNGAPNLLVDARSLYSPPQGARAPVSAIIAVTTIDLATQAVSSVGLLGQADALYVSSGNLFLASSRYTSLPEGVTGGDTSFYTTDIHQLRLAGNAAFVASGTVEGRVRADPDGMSFRLSEADGKLRVVTASGVMWGASTKNRLTILEPSAIAPGLLRTVSFLPNSQRTEPIGKPGEDLYGVRFAGDKLYAVSFRRVDPLYVVDLANPADPRITGSLEVPGFSEYLHPLPGGLLLGFGQDTAILGGRTVTLGLQLTLFDVSNAGQPREMQRIPLGKTGSMSPLSASHHAFSMLRNADGTATLGIPARIHGGEATNPNDPPGWQQFSWQYSGLLRFRLVGTTPATASLQVLDPLVTHRPQSVYGSYQDPAYMGTARSVLFERGPVYVGGGLFWREDTNGAALGPF
ncbi:hypothetical protein DSM104443_01918 [Usitatibacter rugosus]|uniref:Beta propeller domain-containing protein n=1 Tax=Usitatibacter rugosus TaxID=2732067 RepID=A0A6M4GVD3_9PROT|nr:beta-propeller domain-containing protein [Usitatibacter rugosus]QJR10848.1 hypothetical protein DSM104443_01918 [Usitatibacter rugosus]